jgi:LysM repeat protein
MKRILPVLPALCLLSFSCKDRAGDYDTNSVTPPPPVRPPANPVYESAAAYEHNTAQPPSVPQMPPIPTTPPDPSAVLPTRPAPSLPTVPAVPAPPVSPYAAATIHTVVAGDTLSGLSAKYGVPMESIKAANRMTSDTVVLGRKMVIPPR